MAAPLLLDLSHTSHTFALTGIQRQSRALLRSWGDRTLPVTYDPFLRGWRPIRAWERQNLAETSGGRRAHWPVSARLRGILERWLASARSGGARRPSAEERLFERHGESGFFCAELFSPAVAAAFPRLFDRVRGPHGAIFCDAIALQYPEWTPRGTVARFPAYLEELLAFDGVAAISEESRRVLLEYWAWMGVRDVPQVTVIPLGVDAPAPVPLGAGAPKRAAGASDPDPPIVLCVGTIEGRKNHLGLLTACGLLWDQGHRVELRIVGLARPETAAAALRKIDELKSAGRPLRFQGPASEAELEAAYAEAAFTVYPSFVEGFGLPVIESLVRGKPCICSNRGALGEISRKGGCMALDQVDPSALAGAIGRLLSDPAERARLSAEARARRFRTWGDYASDLEQWLAGLPTGNRSRLRHLP